MARRRYTCDCGCGKPYYRRNLTQQWVKRNPGHRAGWKQETLRINPEHQTAFQSKKVMIAAKVSFTPKLLEEAAKERKAARVASIKRAS